jgi:biotin carboxylase
VNTSAPRRAGLLFAYDWDALAFAEAGAAGAPGGGAAWRFDHAGFDLFSFPSNARLLGFDLDRFAAAQAARGRRRGWRAVLSHHEQFGALAAALVAERLALPGTPVEAVLACQHKLHARRVLERVCPEANLPFEELRCEYGGTIPQGLAYPAYVKPVKAAFSVLAREVANRDALIAHTRFGRRELFVIRRLVEPFERVCRARLPQAGSAHRMLLEAPVQGAAQFNLDGYVLAGRARAVGVVDAVMYPGTQAFMRWEAPSRLPAAVQRRALDVAQRFLEAVGFTHGFFNLEFFWCQATGRLSVIEVNPRLASQFTDLYRRVHGLDTHAMSLALAAGDDPAEVPVAPPAGGAAASLVYRTFRAEDAVGAPSRAQREAFASMFPDALLFCWPKRGHALERDFKWLGSHRHGIIHLHGRDRLHLRERCEAASAVLGWTPPYLDEPMPDAPARSAPREGGAPARSEAPGPGHATRPSGAENATETA